MTTSKETIEGALKIVCALDIDIRSINELHELRELTMIALSMQEGVDAISAAESGVAPHYMEHAIRIERTLAEQNPGLSKTELAEQVLSAFNGKVNQEVAFLRQHHGWEKTDLPRVAHQAVRKVRGALEFGGSLRELQTTNKCAEYARDRKKERDNKAAAALDKLSGFEAPANLDGVGAPANNVPEGYETEFPAELRPVLDEYLAKLKQAAIMDPVTTAASLSKGCKTLDNVIQTAKNRFAARAQQGVALAS